MTAPQLFGKPHSCTSSVRAMASAWVAKSEPSKDFAHGGLSMGCERSWRWDLARTEEIDHSIQSADDFVPVSCNQGIEQVLPPQIVVGGRRRLATLRVLEAW